jgi:hypothetical protein
MAGLVPAIPIEIAGTSLDKPGDDATDLALLR